MIFTRSSNVTPLNAERKETRRDRDTDLRRVRGISELLADTPSNFFPQSCRVFAAPAVSSNASSWHLSLPPMVPLSHNDFTLHAQRKHNLNLRHRHEASRDTFGALDAFILLRGCHWRRVSVIKMEVWKATPLGVRKAGSSGISKRTLQSNRHRRAQTWWKRC